MSLEGFRTPPEEPTPEAPVVSGPGPREVFLKTLTPEEIAGETAGLTTAQLDHLMHDILQDAAAEPCPGTMGIRSPINVDRILLVQAEYAAHYAIALHVLDEVFAERVRQVEECKHGGNTWSFDANNDRNDWVAYVTSYAGYASSKVRRNDRRKECFRENMLKVAAIACAAVEAYDKGWVRFPDPHGTVGQQGLKRDTESVGEKARSIIGRAEALARAYGGVDLSPIRNFDLADYPEPRVDEAEILRQRAGDDGPCHPTCETAESCGCGTDPGTGVSTKVILPESDDEILREMLADADGKLEG